MMGSMHEHDRRRGRPDGPRTPSTPEPALPAGVSNALLARAAEKHVARVLTGMAHVEYGDVHPDHGTATRMHAELRGAPSGGSKPSVEPVWWPREGHAHAATAKWFSRYVVQGHLLNEHVGGPGDDLHNLTPLTKKANSEHHAAAEKNLKEEHLKKGKIIEYDVKVQYPTGNNGLTGEGVGLSGATAQDFTANFGSRLPKILEADVTVYDANEVWEYGEGWVVRNEAYIDHQEAEMEKTDTSGTDTMDTSV
jgi:hypothetical protein